MKLSQLSLADYNQLDNIPVINQDLSASGFTPVANTYYRHTGTTTDTFTQGVIYLYDTAYHKLGESGGGTTLNKYTFTVNTKPSVAQVTKILKILNSAVRILYVESNLSAQGVVDLMTEVLYSYQYKGKAINAYSNVFKTYSVLLRNDIGESGIEAAVTEFKDSAFSTTTISLNTIAVAYLNDTEIT